MCIDCVMERIGIVSNVPNFEWAIRSAPGNMFYVLSDRIDTVG